MQVAVWLPSVVSTVIVAFPVATAVTTPEEFTVATLVLLLDQVTDLSVALFGATVAVNVSVEPTEIVVEFLFKDTPVTCTVESYTVTEHVPDFVVSTVDVAVIVTVPVAFAVTVPVELTVAMLLLPLVHVTV